MSEHLFALSNGFLEAQLLYPEISNNKEVCWLLSDTLKNKIICSYDFELYKNEIHNMNKTHYSDLYMYTEAKSVSILDEEKKLARFKFKFTHLLLEIG